MSTHALFDTEWPSLDFDGWVWVKHERTKSKEHLLQMVFIDSGHLQHNVKCQTCNKIYKQS